jgi:polar amino acid transport system substrate-binding protein
MLRTRVVTWAMVVAFVASAPSCRFPRDPEGTLDRVRGGQMRIGLIESDPFVRFEDGEADGVEVTLIERFARRLDARVAFTRGSESELIEALHQRELDVVIGGLTLDSPWEKEVALSRPYVTTKTVVALRPGQHVPDNLAGVTVAVEAGTEAAGLLEAKTDADVRRVSSVDDADPPLATEDYLLKDLRLRRSGIVLGEREHCVAVQLGENAFLVELERFLLDRTALARRLLREKGRP